MFTIKLSINKEDKSKIEEIENYFYSLIGSLQQNGQIFGSGLNRINENSTEIFSILSCPERDSLKLKFANLYVKNNWSRLEEVSQSVIRTKLLGSDIESKNQCCNKTTFYILFTNFLDLNSPLLCGNCFSYIPLYKIPQTDKGHYHNIISWANNYRSCDTLQMNSEVGEKFGLKQMSDYKSKLSQQGLEICQRIENLTGKYCYYYLFNYRKKENRINYEIKCPSCKGDWILKSSLHNLFDFKCDRCKLLSNISTNA